AGVDALSEKVLVRVGDGGRVRIDAGVAGVHAGEERAGRAGHRDADPRLEDAIALGDAPLPRVEVGAVQGMDDDADELARGLARQPRVAVERDAIAHFREDAQLADLHLEARVGGAAQEAVELLDLPALALPAHPGALAGVPLADAVEEEEAVLVLGGVAEVQLLDPAPRLLEQRDVVG